MTDATVQRNDYQPEENDPTIRVALLVEYCGTAFHGSQFQPGQPTVQQAIQTGLAQLHLTTSAVSFAGRTDAGVHALSQVAHFDLPEKALHTIPHLPSALNAVLPESVSIRGAYINTGMQFNSRRDASCKWYRYSIYNSVNRSVWAARHASALYRQPLDADAMNAAAQRLLGTHNFKSFKDSDTHVVNDICTVYHANVSRDGDFINFDIAADRFLYKMVRNIAGQLIAIGNTDKPLPPDTILTVLGQQDRSKAAAPARPEGLSLMAIDYKAPFNYFEADVYVQQLKTILKPMESPHHENLFRKAS
jgi:tRNA pseudouridine38-40 synthase